MNNRSKLLDSGKWFEVLTTHLPMVFYALDSNGVFTLSEGLGLAKLGLKPGQVVGMSAFDVYRDYPEICEAINRALKGESVMLEHNVGDFYIENHFVPQYDKDNKVTALICAAIDISERAAAEHELKQTQQKLLEMNKTLEEKVAERTQELIQANRDLTDSYEKVKTMQSHLIQSEKMAALGGLVAGVAHEINTPLGVGMTAVTHLLEITKEFIEHVKLEDVSREELLSYAYDLDKASGIIFKNINRSSKLVRSFKQVSADQASEPRRPFMVREYMEEILTSLSPRLKKTNIKVSVECDGSISMDGYPGAFAQIITNLVMNSLTHAYGPKDEGNIRISVADLKDMVELVYSDDGTGISEANLSRIFDPFFTTSRGAGGTGLGLTVVYNIVTQQYGGTIQCSSQSGRGTTFVICLKQGGV